MKITAQGCHSRKNAIQDSELLFELTSSLYYLQKATGIVLINRLRCEDKSVKLLATWPPLNANNLATLGRLEKLKIAARPARIDADDDIDISI